MDEKSDTKTGAEHWQYAKYVSGTVQRGKPEERSLILSPQSLYALRKALRADFAPYVPADM